MTKCDYFGFKVAKRHVFLGVPFFLVSISSNSNATVKPLKDFEDCQREGHKVNTHLSF